MEWQRESETKRGNDREAETERSKDGQKGRERQIYRKSSGERQRGRDRQSEKFYMDCAYLYNYVLVYTYIQSNITVMCVILYTGTYHKVCVVMVEVNVPYTLCIEHTGVVLGS